MTIINSIHLLIIKAVTVTYEYSRVNDISVTFSRRLLFRRKRRPALLCSVDVHELCPTTPAPGDGIDGGSDGEDDLAELVFDAGGLRLIEQLYEDDVAFLALVFRIGRPVVILPVEVLQWKGHGNVIIRKMYLPPKSSDDPRSVARKNNLAK